MKEEEANKAGCSGDGEAETAALPRGTALHGGHMRKSERERERDLAVFGRGGGGIGFRFWAFAVREEELRSRLGGDTEKAGVGCSCR